nr:restriction endonuclease subunit S [Acinetobacter sp. YH12058]
MEYQKLGDVADFIRGITYKPNDLVDNFSEGSTVCMRTANVQVQLKQDDLLSVPANLVKNKDKFLIEGDILVSTANSWNLVGKCCWIPKLEYSATAGGFISILRANQEKLDQRYLYHWFNSPNTQLLARNCGRQTTNISNMDLDRCLSIKIPLPPLSEQRRIASILDQADELRQKRLQAIEKLDQLLQATFIDMFGDPVSNPKGWVSSTLGEQCEVGTGSTPSRQNADYFEGNIPWVKSTEVDWGTITYTSETISEDGKNSARLKIYPKGSIILALYGQGITRGKSALLGIEATLNQACAALIPKEPISNYFVFSFLRFSYENLRNQARGGNQENLNLNIVKSFPIYLPPNELQEKWSKIALGIEDQKQNLYKQLNMQNQLFSSLQTQAFNGSL